MPVTIDTGHFFKEFENSTTTSFTTTGSATVGAGDNLLVVFVEAFSNTTSFTLGGVSWNGTALTFLGRATNTNICTIIECWYLKSPTAGTGTIAVTGVSVALGGFSCVFAIPLSGVNTASPFGTTATASNQTGAPISVTVSGGGANDMYLGVGQNNGSALSSTGANQTSLGQVASIIASADYIPGSFSGAFTWTGTGGGNAVAFAVPVFGLPAPIVGQTTPTTGGTENNSGGGNAMEWHVFTAYASGTATSLNVYIDTLTTATTIFLGLYNNTTGALLASGSATIVNGLNTVSISNTPIVYGQQYALAWQSSNTTNVKIVDDGTNNMCFFGTNTAGSMPATLPSPQSPTNLGVPSIYVSGNLGPGAQGKPLGGPSRTQWHWRSSGGGS